MNATEIAALEEQGFVVQPLIGIIDFLNSGVHEIKNDAVWVLIPSAFVIAVLAYSFIGSETADRRHDIGIVKTLGAGRKRVLGYLLLNALVISAWGGLLGVALGVVLSYALSTAASAMFTSVFMIETSEMLLVVSFFATVGAGVLGALIPAVKMTLTSPVQDLKEVAPFS
jgi:putative ABC transport system permease protein